MAANERKRSVISAWMGCLAVLAAAAVVLAPPAAFRSMADELDVGTLELLLSTNLSAARIVSGKLLAALLHTALHVGLAVVAAFVIHLVVLRELNFDPAAAAAGLATIFSTMAIGLATSAFALALAVGGPSRGGRTGGFCMLLAVALPMCVYTVQLQRVNFVGHPYSIWHPYGAYALGALDGMWNARVVAVAASYAFVCSAAAAPGLTSRARDRSMRLRVAVAVQIGVFGVCAALQYLPAQNTRSGEGPFSAFPLVAALHLAFYGAAFVGEPSTPSGRATRGRPTSILERLCFRWLRPGSASGLVFCIALMLGVVVWTVVAPRLLDDYLHKAPVSYAANDLAAMLACAYLATFLGVGRLLIRLLDRGRSMPRFPSWAVFGTLAVAVVFLLRSPGWGWLAPSLNLFDGYQTWWWSYRPNDDAPLATLLLTITVILVLKVGWKGIVKELRPQAEPATPVRRGSPPAAPQADGNDAP